MLPIDVQVVTARDLARERAADVAKRRRSLATSNKFSAVPRCYQSFVDKFADKNGVVDKFADKGGVVDKFVDKGGLGRLVDKGGVGRVASRLVRGLSDVGGSVKLPM